METNREYYLISKDAVPEILLKVYEAKKMLDRDGAINIKDAVQAVGISRSAFYKYKDAIEKYTPLKIFLVY